LFREIRRPGLWALWAGGERVHHGLTMGGRLELADVECTGAPGRKGLLRKLGEGEGDSAELTKVRVVQCGGREDWRGEEGMTMGMDCGGGGQGVAPFYRVGEVGRWPAG
jgi:hypothetical protein